MPEDCTKIFLTSKIILVQKLKLLFQETIKNREKLRSVLQRSLENLKKMCYMKDVTVPMITGTV